MRKLRREVISRSKKGLKHQVVLVYDENFELIKEKCSCTCAYGSFYKWSKKNQENGNIVCFHIKKVYKQLTGKELK